MTDPKPEPAYEDNAVYIDADGEIFLFLADEYYLASWQRLARPEWFTHGVSYPRRPLRKFLLGPEED